MSNFTHCRERGVLTTTEGGERVNYSTMMAGFNKHETCRWYCQGGSIGCDEFGLMPESVEAFLRTLPQAAKVQRDLF